MKQQKGFTLIELIMVVVILGILAAFALPRFQDFGQNARVATAQGIDGAIRSASAIARASCLSIGTCDQTAAGSTVNIDGVAVAMDFGYPTGDAGGIDVAAQINGIVPVFAAGVMTVTLPNAPTPATCVVTYTEAASAVAPPVIVTNVAGC